MSGNAMTPDQLGEWMYVNNTYFHQLVDGMELLLSKGAMEPANLYHAATLAVRRHYQGQIAAEYEALQKKIRKIKAEHDLRGDRLEADGSEAEQRRKEHKE